MDEILKNTTCARHSSCCFELFSFTVYVVSASGTCVDQAESDDDRHSCIWIYARTKEGMLIGFFSGLLIDVQFGNILGFYALIYLLIGYINGLFEQMYYDEDIKLPLILIAASELVYGMVIYVLMFLFGANLIFYTI